MASTIDAVRSFFVAQRLVPSGNAEVLDEGASLLEGGIIDSLNLLDLVSYLEQRFEVKILDTDLMPDNFETLKAIVSLIEKRQA